MSNENCRDCSVKPGEFHLSGCAIEICSLCGDQAVTCACVYTITLRGIRDKERRNFICDSFPTDEMFQLLDEEVEKYGGRLVWTGELPNLDVCREFSTDLNKLPHIASWSKEKRKWIKND